MYCKVMLKIDQTILGCMIVAIYGSDRRLAFCRPGNKKWTKIGQAHQYDAIFWRNQLYVVDCDIGVLSPKPMVVIDVGIRLNEKVQAQVMARMFST